MPALYAGRYPVPVFANKDPDEITNGTRAAPSLLMGIADNQTWLATQDTPRSNFYTNSDMDHNRSAQKIKFCIDMPPFSKWVEFWFWVVWNLDDGISTPPYIRIDCTETSSTRKAFAGSGGSDTPAGKGASGNGVAQQAKWMSFSGTEFGDLADPDDHALALVGMTTPDNLWNKRNFEVYTVASSDVQAPIILSGYYRVVPASGLLYSAY